MTERARDPRPDDDILAQMMQPGTPQRELDARKEEALRRQRLGLGHANAYLRRLEVPPDEHVKALVHGVETAANVEADMRWIDALEAAGIPTETIITIWDDKADRLNKTKGETDEEGPSED